eukprot:6985209-Pyramimonas_sp.AAC.1
MDATMDASKPRPNPRRCCRSKWRGCNATTNCLRNLCKGSGELEAALINHFTEADELDYPRGLADDCDPDVLS